MVVRPEAYRPYDAALVLQACRDEWGSVPVGEAYAIFSRPQKPTAAFSRTFSNRHPHIVHVCHSARATASDDPVTGPDGRLCVVDPTGLESWLSRDWSKVADSGIRVEHRRMPSVRIQRAHLRRHHLSLTRHFIGPTGTPMPALVAPGPSAFFDVPMLAGHALMHAHHHPAG